MESIAELLHETWLLKDKLLEFPLQIKNQKAQIRKYREELNAKNQEKAMLEAEFKAAIAAEKDPNSGKAAYGNAEARQAELVRRTSQDERYKQITEEVRRAEFQVAEAQEELELLQDQYKSYRYVAQIVTAELNVYALQEEDPEDARYVPTEKGWAVKANGGQPY